MGRGWKEKKGAGRGFEIKVSGSWSLEAGAPEAGQAENHAARGGDGGWRWQMQTGGSPREGRGGEERRAEEADPAPPPPPSTSSGQSDTHVSSLVC